MSFTVINGKVPYLMIAGKDTVKGEMPVEAAQKIYAEGTYRPSRRFEGYPIGVNDRYFFAGKTGKGRKSSCED